MTAILGSDHSTPRMQPDRNTCVRVFAYSMLLLMVAACSKSGGTRAPSEAGASDGGAAGADAGDQPPKCTEGFYEDIKGNCAPIRPCDTDDDCRPWDQCVSNELAGQKTCEPTIACESQSELSVDVECFSLSEISNPGGTPPTLREGVRRGSECPVPSDLLISGPPNDYSPFKVADCGPVDFAEEDERLCCYGVHEEQRGLPP